MDPQHHHHHRPHHSNHRNPFDDEDDVVDVPHPLVVVNSPNLSHADASDFSPEDIHHLLFTNDDDNNNHNEDDDDNNDTTTKLARVERKRSREKQRRSDVNQQFAALTALLRQLESHDPELAAHLPSYSPNNRVELMARVMGLMESMYETVKKQKAKIESLEHDLALAQQAGEETAQKLKERMMAPQPFHGGSNNSNQVVMMVPMIMTDNAVQPWMGGFAAAAANTSSGPSSTAPTLTAPTPMMMPWMMPSMPSMAAAATAAATATATAASATFTAHTAAPPTLGDAAPDATTKPEATNANNKSEVGGNLAHCA